MKFVSEILPGKNVMPPVKHRLRRDIKDGCRRINVNLCQRSHASTIVCAVKFENSFARRQHLFGIAGKPTDVD